MIATAATFSGPVTPASRPVRRAAISYTEVGGRPVLCDTVRATAHMLNAAGGALWAALDGRSIREIAAEAGAATTADLVESIRRLRALGVVDEGEHVEAPAQTNVALELMSEERLRALSLRGHKRLVDTELLVVLEACADATVTIEHVPYPNISGERVAAMHVSEVSPGAIRLTSFEAFRQLVSCTMPHDLVRPNAADNLADLAEMVPVFVPR